ncbi:hypothetical protein SNE40_006950 [Patella caerulea]|uniref:Tectonic domain-containing protein n=1 Tax=Patella caerulea TaxID=87958 RepID=A0AAN8PT39_PATCE
MKIARTLFGLFITSMFLFTAYGQEIGKVVIDGFGSSSAILSNSSDYYFSVNDGTSRFLHVSIVIVNAAGDTVALSQTVAVTCEQITSGTGFTDVTFSTLNFVVGGTTSGQVQISPVTAGRSVNVRCFGQTIPIDPTCPQTPTSTTQFCKTTSFSDIVLLRLQPPPIVSFCELVIQVANTNINNNGEFTVKLSDPVIGSPVEVSCIPATAAGSITINIPVVVAAVGSTDVQMAYTVTATGNAVTVSCSANSQTGNQYQTANSVDPTTSTARFTVETGTIQLIPVFTQIHTTSLEVFLVLDKAVTRTGDVSGVCQSDMVETLDEAKVLYNNPACTPATTTSSTTEPTTETTTTLPTTTVALPTTTFDNSTIDVNATTVIPSTTFIPITTIPPDLTSAWTIDEPVFQFTRAQYYKTFVSRRQLDVIGDIKEYVVITCCVQTPSINEYNGQSVAMIADADLSVDLCANCTGGVTTGESASERIITNPAFLEIAPCPCDVTFKACDIQCCCDTDCTDDVKNTFSSCLPGLAGGLPAPTPDRSCVSTNPFKDDWFPLTCVVFEENGFLGLFHENQPKITSDVDFNQRVASKKNLFTLGETEERFNDPNSALRGYQYGASIRTNRADITVSDKGVLALPQRSASGHCVRTAPVRFLNNSASDCTSTASASVCTISSILSARVYAEPSTIFKPPCPEGFEICEEYGTTVPAPSYVNYYCADSSYMQNYLKTSTTFDSIVQPTVPWLFNSSLQNENCDSPCENLNCVSYNNGRQEAPVALPPRCNFDDGFTRAGIPQVVGTNCENSVVDVRYRFTWSGQKVVRLDADIILGALPLSGSPAVTQNFQVVFNQENSGPNNSSDNYNQLNMKYDRSGNPGYDFGKPVFSGCSNVTGAGFAGVNQDVINQMAVWKPESDGLCFNAKRRGLTFGEDMTSGCTLRLGLTEINDCDNLKTLVLNHLNTLMPANVLGRLGYNDPNNQTFWVQILRQNLTELLNVSSDSSNITSPIDDLKGICYNITSSINLHVLYAETGKGNGYPIREILGAGITYTLSDWQLSCKGSSCRNNSNRVETFLLTSTVRYIKVLAQTPIKPIQFWAIHNDPSCQTDSCQRYFENFDRSTCHYDTCWHELFYPMSSSYDADTHMYVLGFTLVSVVFIVGYYMVAQKNKLVYGISKDNSLGNIINTFPTECCT